MNDNPKMQVARLDDIGRRGRSIPVREHLGIHAFGVNAFTPENGTLINEHDEAGSGQEELYIVLDGNATFEFLGTVYTSKATPSPEKSPLEVDCVHTNGEWKGKVVKGIYKAELIKPRGPWRTAEQVELATLDYVDWYNHRRLFETCGDIPPAELETAHYRQNTSLAEAG